MNNALRIAGLCWLVLSCAGPEKRAMADLAVGRAAAGGVRFTVEDGLAAVRVAEPGSLTLWCGAPVLSFTADAESAGEWTIELRNVISDATLAGDAVIAPLLSPLPTRKRFRVTLPAGTTTLHVTTPDADDRSTWRWALLSDVQEAVDEVQDLFTAIDAQPELRFLLGAGDLASTGSHDELLRFQAELEQLDIPYYTTLGNHDAPPNTSWHALYGRANFSFVFRGVQFTLVDSASATIEPMVYDWLDDWLEQGINRVHVFAMHIPAIDPVGTRNGSFGSRNEAAKLLTKLAAGRVDLTLYGHLHSFYAYENGGIQAYISGGGGAIPERLDDYNRHFMVFEVGADDGIVSTDVVQLDE